MVERILENLKQVRRRGDSQWTACCPAHDDKNPSLSISVGAEGILLKCFAGCETDNVAQALGLTLRDLFFADRQPLSPVKTITEPSIEPLGLQPWAQRLWDDSEPLSGTALDYLQSRRCAIPPTDGDLRWHKSVKHQSGYVGAALIGLVTHIQTNEPMSLHRTWITSTGKADVKPNRMLAGKHSARHGVIRLYPDDCVTEGLALGEGIETCLSMAHDYEPVWSTISATNLANLPAIEVAHLVIGVDADEAGRKAAEACARRWHDAGVTVSLMRSRIGDLNDEVRYA